MLTQAQANAINYVRDYAKTRRSNAINTIDHILRMSNISRSHFDELIEKTKSQARVAFHFHPDRLDPVSKTVAQALLESGIYKSQFETLLSSGSVSAHPGGARDLWEQQLFGGAYQHAGVDNSQRPKYGALDLLSHPDGPSPRFGSCYFLLKPEVTKRCTFTYLDSHMDPKEKGTFDEFEGFSLNTDKVPSDFRGPKMPFLAKKVAPDGLLTARKIGEAAASLKRDPNLWTERGTESDVLQELKLLWHVLLRFGN